MTIKVVHITTVITAVVSAVLAGLYGIIGQLPAKWQAGALVIVSVGGLVVIALKVIDASLATTQGHLDRVHDTQVHQLLAGQPVTPDAPVASLPPYANDDDVAKELGV